MTNYGLIEEERRDEDWILGSEEMQGAEVWEKRRLPKQTAEGLKIDRSDIEPEFELQKKLFETNSCVSFSGTTGVEYDANELILSKKVETLKVFLSSIGLLKNGRMNASDRRTAKGSGTDPNRGNTVRAVDDYIRNNLFCPEDLYPFPEGMTRDEYFQVMPAEVADYGKKCAPGFGVQTKYLPVSPMNIYGLYSSPEQIWDGLQYGVIWASVDPRYELDDDGFVSGKEFIEELGKEAGIRLRNYGHRILVRGGVYGKYLEVHDQYQQQIRKFAWDYPFGGCKVMQIVKKNLSPFAKYGSAIFMRGKTGALSGQLLAFDSGDVFQGIFGDYANASPKDELAEMPTDFKKIIIQ